MRMTAYFPKVNIDSDALISRLSGHRIKTDSTPDDLFIDDNQNRDIRSKPSVPAHAELISRLLPVSLIDQSKTCPCPRLTLLFPTSNVSMPI